MSFAGKQKMIGKIVTSSSTPEKVTLVEDGEYIYYTVKSGDTLWDIAKKYSGVTDTDIMRLNDIDNPGKIKPGQRLKIVPKDSTF